MQPPHVNLRSQRSARLKFVHEPTREAIAVEGVRVPASRTASRSGSWTSCQPSAGTPSMTLWNTAGGTVTWPPETRSDRCGTLGPPRAIKISDRRLGSS